MVPLETTISRIRCYYSGCINIVSNSTVLKKVHVQININCLVHFSVHHVCSKKLKSPGQMITTFQRNIVGPVFASPAKRLQQFNTTLLGTTCGMHLATLSQHVGCCKSNYCACLGTALLHEPSQMTAGATSCNIHKCCIKNLTIFKLEPTTL